MKIKLNNMELVNYKEFFKNFTNRQNDVKAKWLLAKFYMQIKELCDLADNELRNIINNEGVKEKDENGKEIFKLDFKNEKFIEFKDIENEIDIKPMTLNNIEKMIFDIDDMVMLSKFIEE